MRITGNMRITGIHVIVDEYRRFMTIAQGMLASQYKKHKEKWRKKKKAKAKIWGSTSADTGNLQIWWADWHAFPSQLSPASAHTCGPSQTTDPKRAQEGQQTIPSNSDRCTKATRCLAPTRSPVPVNQRGTAQWRMSKSQSTSFSLPKSQRPTGTPLPVTAY